MCENIPPFELPNCENIPQIQKIYIVPNPKNESFFALFTRLNENEFREHEKIYEKPHTVNDDIILY